MERYELVLEEAASYGLAVKEKNFESKAHGLIKGRKIGIRKELTTTQKTCALMEEITHYRFTVGDILDHSRIDNRKQERRAREQAYNYLIPLQRIVDAHRARVNGRYAVAECLGVTEEFLQDCINRYIDKYGLFAVVGNYTIFFDPLAVVERFT